MLACMHTQRMTYVLKSFYHIIADWTWNHKNNVISPDDSDCRRSTECQQVYTNATIIAAQFQICALMSDAALHRKTKPLLCSRQIHDEDTPVILTMSRSTHFFDIELQSQSSPSYKPSPLVAQQLWMYQPRFLIEESPSFSVISAADIAFGKSCLLAKTKRMASRISSSLSILFNSSRASPMRSLSLESITKIKPVISIWIFLKTGCLNANYERETYRHTLFVCNVTN